MSTHTHSQTRSKTYTLTEAKYLGSKLIADMDRCRQIYGRPAQNSISNFHRELIALLHQRYLATYEFGFAVGETRIISWKYWAEFGDIKGGNENPGSLYRRADISGASWFNFVTYSAEWCKLTSGERDAFKQEQPFYRGSGSEKKDGNGYWRENKSYSATGAVITRREFVPYA
jgi:hypothetical protein